MYDLARAPSKIRKVLRFIISDEDENYILQYYAAQISQG